MDPSQGIAGLKKLSAATDTEMTSAESRLKSFGANAMKIGVGGLAAGAFLTELGDKEKASAQQLDAAIESVGQSVDDYKDRIEKAGEEQAKFGHSQVDVNNALNTLTLSYGDTGKALDELQLTADLAAKKHIGLADAATMVAKAHGGAARLFKEFNIQVKENADGTKDYDGALRELQDKLSGQASAAADTFTGKLTALRTEVENQVAAFGQKYGPAVLAVSAAMTAFGGIASAVGAIQEKVAASHVASAAAAAAQAAAEEEAAAAVVAAAAEEEAARIAAMTVDSTVATAAEANALRKVVGNESVTFSNAEVVAATQTRAAAEMQALIGSDALIAADEGLTVANTEVSVSSGAAVVGIEAESAAMDGAAVSAGAFAAGIGGITGAIALLPGLGAGAGGMRGVKDMAVDTADANAILAASVSDIQASWDKFKNNLNDPETLNFFKHVADTSVPAAKKIRDALAAEGVDVTILDGILADHADTQTKAAAATDAATQSAKQQKDAMDQAAKAVQNYTGFIGDLAGAMEKTYQGTVSQIKLHSSFEAGIDDLNKALWTNGKTLDDNTEAGRANISAALNAGDSIAKLAEAKFQETHNTQDAINTASIYTAALDDQLKAAGLNEDQIHYMNAEMGLTPEQIQTTFSNNAVEQQIVIGKYLDQLDKIPADQKTYIEALIDQGKYDQANNQLNYLAGARVAPFYADVFSDPNLFRSSNIGGARAGGGSVDFGSSYLVGEKGPELFTPGASGAITPTDVTAGLMGGSGHTFNIYETSPRETAVEVANRLRAEAMLSGV